MEKLALMFTSLLLTGFTSTESTSVSHRFVGGYSVNQVDGPYVLYRNDKVIAKYLIDNNGIETVKEDSTLVSQKNNLMLHVATDEPGKTFQVHLKNKLEKEKSEFRKSNKLFVLSDIEGNFAAFRKLLQANGVIDKNYNWTFGDGQLVLVGDFFDRGSQVTEVLWLIYSLEDKAKAAGGYVHFILGNHEIMNLSNDLRYLNSKYVSATVLLSESYETLYGENSELGRWLRTKNVIERIGNMLFTHGGISQAMNQMNVSISDINNLARPFYTDTVYSYTDPRVDTIYGELGPFWYRGYYMGTPMASSNEIDSTLSKFFVKHIVTGHTIVADTISLWHHGKLIDTDVHHAAGKSEALLVEGKKFYRVNSKGDKILIMDR